jgi:t-SNARE complex subunit (syntaxin)
MTMLAIMQMLFLVSTMLIRQQEELNVIERNTCNCSCHTWKPTSHVMVTKVLRIALRVLACSLL